MEKFGKYPVISISLKSIIAESKKESGKKRYDILIRHKESDKVYVVELKKDDSLEAAFAQMKEKEYAKGYSDVTYVAIVHNGKEVLVDMKKSI